ncbi:hypothetical protein GOODEAATRI_030960, partial [Goodea atripinnis]
HISVCLRWCWEFGVDGCQLYMSRISFSVLARKSTSLEPRVKECLGTPVITVTDNVGLTFMTGRVEESLREEEVGFQWGTTCLPWPLRKLYAVAVMEMYFKRSKGPGLSSRMCTKVIRPPLVSSGSVPE